MKHITIPEAKCNQCAFKHMRHPADSHCYMFKVKPGDYCAQYKMNIRDAGSAYNGGRSTART